MPDLTVFSCVSCVFFDRFDVPEDGFPSIEDWNHTFSSVLLDGLELTRAPLDVSIADFKPDSFLSAIVQLSSLQVHIAVLSF